MWPIFGISEVTAIWIVLGVFGAVMGAGVVGAVMSEIRDGVFWGDR
jgi:hypothetical protein